MAAPSGNTLHGELPRIAPDPSEVRPYRAERYAPPTEVTRPPRPLGACAPPPSAYPEAAQRLGIEGPVVLRILVDADGGVADPTIVDEPGHGLGPAAVAVVRRHCRFEPGRRGEERVATWVRYTVRFVLP